jgi:hypothetical protein
MNLKMHFPALPLLVVARAGARRGGALEARRIAVIAEPPAAAPGGPRPCFELVRRYVLS